MSAYPAWTPASRPGIVPLHPLSFGTILGRSFVALRQNPRVLLGFALVVQTVAYIVVLVAIGGVAWATFSRLGTLRPGSDDFNTVMAGSVAITAIAGILLGLAAAALSTIVQAVVVVEVTHAVVAEKLTLGAIWRQVKPIVWRLIGWGLLVALVVVAVFLVLGLLLFGLGAASPPAAVGIGIVLLLAAIPLGWWLSIKLLLVPSIIIVEHATIGQAIPRAWRLVRGRFWSSLGVVFLISMTFSVVAQVVSIPFSFLSAGLTTIISPTGDPEVGAIIGGIVTLLITYAVLLLLQSVALVVQATGTALIYVDCRMRHEGLDFDLLAYTERRDAGEQNLPDPYRQNVGRAIGPRQPAYQAYPGYVPAPGQPAYPTPAAAQGYPQGYGPQGQPVAPVPGYAQPGYAQPQYTQPGYAPPPQQYPFQPSQPQGYAPQQQPSGYAPQQQPQPQPQGYAAQGAPAGPGAHAQTHAPAYPPAPPLPAPPDDAASAASRPAPPAPTQWAAPGTARPERADPESPWS